MNLAEFLRKKLEDGSAKTLLRSPWVYRALSPFLKSQPPSVQFGFNLLKEAYLGEKPVAFTSLFFPSELVFALGMVPFPLEVISGVVASMGLAVPFLKKAEEEWYSQDMCSFHRLGIGLALQGYLPQPKVVLSTSCLCDGSHRFFHNLSRFFNVPHFLIEVPGTDGEREREFLEKQLKNLIGDLEDLLSKKVSRIDWEKTFGWSNGLKEELLKINELQKRIPCPVPGDEALGNVGVIFTCSGSPWGPNLISSWGKNLPENGLKENHRLIWLHLRPYYPSPIFPFLKEKGVSIVGEEFFGNLWPPQNPENPERSLALKILSTSGLGPIKNRLKRTLLLVKERKAEGVIIFAHRGCRQSTGGGFLIKEALKEEGIPCLILDGDCVDPRELNWEQMRTRIEGFLEIL